MPRFTVVGWTLAGTPLAALRMRLCPAGPGPCLSG